MVSVGIVLLVLIPVLIIGTILINLLLAGAPRRGKRPDVNSCAPEPRPAPAAARAALLGHAPRRYFSSEVDLYLRDWLEGETWLGGRPEGEARFYRFVGALLDYYPAVPDENGAARPEPAEIERKLLQASKDHGLALDPAARKRIHELARRVRILYDFADAHAERQSRPQKHGLPPGA